MKKLDMPLTNLKNGESGVIVSIKAQLTNPPDRHSSRRRSHSRWGFRKRLEDMGLTPGTKVTVVKSAPFHGPIELHVRGSRLAIGRGMAKKILVRTEK